MVDSTHLPLVSVLVPAYNHVIYIKDCLQSIADDDYPNLELLVVDDGSSDETFAVATAWLHEHSDRFHRSMIFRQDNRGICATLNRLVTASEGQFLAIVASDDQLVKGGLRARMEALMGHPNWMAVIGYAGVMDSDGNDVAENAMIYLYGTHLRMLHHPRNMSIELILHWSVPGPVFMARRDVYNPDVGLGLYDEEIPIEDRDFYLRLLAQDALGYIQIPVGRYRIHGTNLSRSSHFNHRVSKALVDSCRKNLPNFTGFLRYCLATHLAYVLAYEVFYRDPSIWSYFNLVRRRLTVEAVLRGARLLNYINTRLNPISGSAKGGYA